MFVTSRGAKDNEVVGTRNGQQRGRHPPPDPSAGGPAARLRLPSRDSAAANIGSLSGHQRGRQDHVEVVLFHQCRVDATTKTHVGAFTTSLRGIMWFLMSLVRMQMLSLPTGQWAPAFGMNAFSGPLGQETALHSLLGLSHAEMTNIMSSVGVLFPGTPSATRRTVWSWYVGARCSRNGLAFAGSARSCVLASSMHGASFGTAAMLHMQGSATMIMDIHRSSCPSYDVRSMLDADGWLFFLPCILPLGQTPAGGKRGPAILLFEAASLFPLGRSARSGAWLRASGLAS